MRGRKPTPTPILKLRGSRRAKGREGVEPIAPPGVPDIPADLTGEAMTEWNRMIPILRNMGVLSLAERNMLHSYCRLHVQWMAAEAAIDRDGLMVGDRPNPMVSISRGAWDRMQKILIELGFSPTARARVHKVEKKPQKSALARLIDGA